MSTVILPHGFGIGDEWHREAVLRPLAESDLWSAGPATATAITALLTRTLLRLGPYAPPTAEQVADLTVGDREALLLHLRRLSFGSTLAAVLTCAACGEQMDLTLRAEELLLPPGQVQGRYQEVLVDGVTLTLRAPTGSDQAAAADLVAIDPEGATELLLYRCLASTPEGFKLTASGMAALSEHLQAIDPQAETLLDFTCPNCGAPGQTPFDAGAFLLREVAAKQEALLYEIHALALHYHWSEGEILAIPPARRRLYLRLLGLAE